MRAWILSDLHREVSPGAPPLPAPAGGFDVLIAAGDVHEGDLAELVDALARLADGRPVVAVLGNHDLYGLDIGVAAGRAAAIGAPLGVHVLEASDVEVGGLRFCGGTLWDDVGRRPPGAPRPDLTRILSGEEHDLPSPPGIMPFGEPVLSGAGRRATFADLARHRRAALDAIAACDPDVVVTHYPPDAGCLARAPNAAWWIHGHLHAHARRTEGGTEVVVNAAQSRAFAPAMVVDLAPRPGPPSPRGA